MEKKVEELELIELLSIMSRLQQDAQRINTQLAIIDKELKSRIEVFDKRILPPNNAIG